MSATCRGTRRLGKLESLGQVLNEVRESESSGTGGCVQSGGSDELLSMDIFRRVWSVVGGETEAREGGGCKGVDKAVVPPPASE